MRAFFAMIWDTRNEKAVREADALKARIDAALGVDLEHTEARGFALYDLDRDRRSILALKEAAGDCTGAIYGTLFEAQLLSPAARALRSLDPVATGKLRASEGASLLLDYWGSYIAFVATREGFAVIADPTSAIPCFVCEQEAVTLVFSHLERCPFIDRRGFTINDAFITRLLAYDKIQNGETGFNEVRELLGGERLRVPSLGRPPELLWDPRQIAHAVHEPRLDVATDELRHVTRSVIGAWANDYCDLSVNLSGGLDSAILLASIANTRGVENLNAVHFRFDSSDPPENRYAQAMADHVGCELIEVLESARHALPEIRQHPATVRPYRHFVTQDIATRMGDKAVHLKQDLFTGQGGDHLFLHTKGELQFADYLRHHGFSRAGSTHLLDAARLSERSVWAILGKTLPYMAGKSHRSRMITAIETRRTAVNRHAFDCVTIEESIPVWCRTSAGLPPAKFDQVSDMAHMIQAREPLDRFGHRDVIHPLISQPLIELCLRLPTYTLCAGGRSRGLARQAFASDLPDIIRTRSSKGEASHFFIAYLEANSRRIIDSLCDGELVARNLISRSEIEAFMRQNDHQIQKFGRTVLVYYAVEAWLQSCKGSISAPNRSAIIA